MKKNSYFSKILGKILTIILITLLISSVSFARAGGSGGKKKSSKQKSSKSYKSSNKSSNSNNKSVVVRSSNHSGRKGSSSGFGGLIIFGIIVLIVIIVIVIVVAKKEEPEAMGESLDEAVNRLPADTTEEQLLIKAEKAFYQIQESWGKSDVNDVRKFLSDGMYQRFTTQFIMMEKLSQKNIIESVKLNSCKIADAYCDGVFDSVTFEMNASMKDTFVSLKFPELDESSDETFNEYWTFIRKVDHAEGDLYDSNNCPNCGGDISNGVNDIAKCPYCETVTNSGDYDWVLCEISQEDYYDIGESIGTLRDELAQDANEIRESVPDYSVQLLEDKVSNAFFQIEAAKILKKPDLMKRFVSDELFKEVSNTDSLLYSRLFINSVKQNSGCKIKDKMMYINFEIEISYQLVEINNDELEIKHEDLLDSTIHYIMKHGVEQKESKGRLYSNECPSCGAPITDTVDANCLYCGDAYNSGDTEWVVAEIFENV